MNNGVIYPSMVIRSQAETIELQDKEIERLNNIINELEKFMDKDYKWIDKYGLGAPAGSAMGEINRIKRKLQELKDSD